MRETTGQAINTGKLLNISFNSAAIDTSFYPNDSSPVYQNNIIYIVLNIGNLPQASILVAVNTNTDSLAFALTLPISAGTCVYKAMAADALSQGFGHLYLFSVH